MENEKQTAETPLAFEELFKYIDLKDRAKAYVLVEAEPVEFLIYLKSYLK